MDVNYGTLVEAVTASGDTVRMRALEPPTRGRDFPIVWVCTEEEFDVTERTGEEPHRIPWPTESIKVLEAT
ncbi:hypothetical protein I6A60_20370 [Frankia sp. AgB1.9]|uniref:hypothetical protein n=1 Tax=unclassified Frankia TaxID=2632575 RepID=UPI001932BE68|nr:MULTISPECIES: hypothetical protein [unclassified Frankia]MBL7491927.1 hypothetical protein [Frankia sp. AgW1.1]MBL7550216.1 hypothetical protein [Frankia sp. AgB1.9]MBL7619876.1 hypothetical protein [Frankia sp. AgB1.8]